MSATAPVRPGTRPLPKRAAAPAAAPRPQLRVVAPPRLAPGPLPFALLVAGVLGAGLVALLMLHTLAAQDAFTVHKLQRQASTLADEEQQLALANQQAQAPSALAARARALGMVPSGSLRIVRRRDGRVVAVSTAVPAPAPAPKAAPTPASGAAAAAGGATRPAASPSPAASSAAPATRHRASGGH